GRDPPCPPVAPQFHTASRFFGFSRSFLFPISAACQLHRSHLTLAHYADHYQRSPIGSPGHPILRRPRSHAATPVRGPPRLLPRRPTARRGPCTLWLYHRPLPRPLPPVPP